MRRSVEFGPPFEEIDPSGISVHLSHEWLSGAVGANTQIFKNFYTQHHWVSVTCNNQSYWYMLSPVLWSQLYSSDPNIADRALLRVVQAARQWANRVKDIERGWY